MRVELNHTIVPATDKQASAAFLGRILGVPARETWGPFIPLELSNGVTLDFMDAEKFAENHYAFLVSESDFDQIYDRLREHQVRFYADRGRSKLGEINHHYGGRGVYFDDPDQHLMEVITRPYGPVPEG